MGGQIKSLYLATDLEGVAGVVSFEKQAYPAGQYYNDARGLLTQEVNAAIAGALAAGVERLVVADGHGYGAIAYEQLHEAAELIHGRPITPSQLLGLVAECEAVAMIGQHAMAGVATATLNHTSDEYEVDFKKLNGRLVGEIAMFALYAGAKGKPMIFLSGDMDACAEVKALIPGITAAAVKRGLGRYSAVSLSVARARALIREGMEKAITRQRRHPIKPLIWKPPYRLEIRYGHTHKADQVACIPGTERVDGQTVRLKGEDVCELLYRV